MCWFGFLMLREYNLLLLVLVNIVFLRVEVRVWSDSAFPWFED